MKRLLLVAAIGVALSGCGSMNAYTGAAINAGEAGYAGAAQNLKAIDDAKFIGWNALACTMPLGSLQRNATGNPDAVKAILTACPIPGLALVSTTNGSVSVTTFPTLVAPTPTAGYVAPATTPATTVPAK